MTILKNLAVEQEKLKFVSDAAEYFRLHPSHTSFSSGTIESGELLALRWGLDDDCVLVLRVADSPVEIYRNFI